MACATGNYVCDNSSLANFQAWTSAIYDGFINTATWEKSNDTGQADRLIPAVPNSAYVYWVFKSTDALFPIYCKVELGYSSTSLRIRMTVGTASNGSGTITGGCTGTPWELTYTNSNQGSNTYPCFFAGDSGNFRMYLWQSLSITNGLVFGISRSKDSDNTDCVTVLHACRGSGVYANQQTFTASAVGNHETGIITAGLTSGSGTGYSNGSIAGMPILPVLGKPLTALLDFQTCAANDVADGACIPVHSLFGETHRMVVAKGNGITGGCGERGTNATQMALLMRYE